MKTCTKCGLEKEDSEFYKYRNICKICYLEQKKLYKSKPEVKEHYRQHRNDPVIKEKTLKRKEEYYSNPIIKERLRKYRNDPINKERLKKYHNEYYKNPIIKEREQKYRKKYYSDPLNKKRNNMTLRQRSKYRLLNDTLYSLKVRSRGLISKIFKNKGYKKNTHTYQLVGCSYEDLLHFLGPVPTTPYHIDHICPCAQAKNEEELIKLQHYTNLRYLPAKDNQAKGCYKTPEGEIMCKKLLNRDWLD